MFNSTTEFFGALSAHKTTTHNPLESFLGMLGTDSNPILDESVKHKKKPLISDEVKPYVEIIIEIVLFVGISIFGCISNTINAIVYKKQGLKDSITIGFFTLSLSDLIVVLCTLAPGICYLAKHLFPIPDPVFYISLHYVSTARLRQMAYSFSTLLTSFLSIERCFCVTMPLKVKTIFTRRRTLIFIISLVILHVCSTIPIYATHQLIWLDGSENNYTRIVTVWFAPHRQEIEAFNFILLTILTPAVSQVIVIICSIILIRGLKRASLVRQKLNSSNTVDSSVALSNKDTRLVNTMIFLGAILSACNLPAMSLTFAMLAEPEINMGRSYYNLYSFLLSVTYTLAAINASVNIFVYYKNSTKYRQVFKELFLQAKSDGCKDIG